MRSGGSKGRLREVPRRIAGRLRRRLNRLARQVSPGHVGLSVADAEAYAASFGDVRAETFTETEEPGPAIEILHPGEGRLANRAPFGSFLEGVFLDIRHPGFRFTDNHLVDPSGQVVYEPAVVGGALPTLLKRRAKQVGGTVAYLSNTVPGHYGHWMQYMLPLLRLYERFVGLAAIDAFYLGDGPARPFVYECLARLGIGADKVVDHPCRADRLLSLVPNRYRPTGEPKYWDAGSFRFVRGLFEPECGTGQGEGRAPRRLYVRRGEVRWRRVLNEDEIIGQLRPLGFEAVAMDGRSVAEQAALFASAEVVVAAHGAALTNVMFCRPGAWLVEVMPAGYEDATSFAFAAHAGVHYAYLVGVPGGGAAPPCFADLEIPAGALWGLLTSEPLGLRTPGV